MTNISRLCDTIESENRSPKNKKAAALDNME